MQAYAEDRREELELISYEKRSCDVILAAVTLQRVTSPNSQSSLIRFGLLVPKSRQ